MHAARGWVRGHLQIPGVPGRGGPDRSSQARRRPSRLRFIYPLETALETEVQDVRVRERRVLAGPHDSGQYR